MKSSFFHEAWNRQPDGSVMFVHEDAYSN